MKIKTDFVTNSSSSSFIVCFKKRPRTVEEMQKTLFPNGERDLRYYDDKHPIKDIAATVFKDFKDKEYGAKKATIKNVAAQFATIISHAGWDRSSNYSSQNRPYGTLFIDKYTTEEDWEKLLELKVLQDIQQLEWSERDKSVQTFQRTYWKKVDNLSGKMARKAARQWLEERTKMDVIKIFSYSDEDGQGYLEHGGIFDNIEHMTISHH